jgi:hypothetical protein
LKLNRFFQRRDACFCVDGAAGRQDHPAPQAISQGDEKMKMWKKTALSAAIAAGGLLTLAAPAQAYVYSLSTLDISGLTITTTPTAEPGTYTFTLANTATYRSPGTLVGTGNSCTGTFGGATTCGTAGATLGDNTLVLDAPPANGVNNTVNRTNNDFTFIGPTGNYAGSDNVIYDAELVGDASTAAQQIAESALTTDASTATANSEIQSNTQLSWTFTIGSGSLSLNFNADPDQLVTITDAGLGNSAQSNLTTSFTLTNNETNASVSWSPQGTTADDCVVSGFAPGTVICMETADTQDLNRNVAINTATSANNSFDVATLLTAFGIDITGLPSGTYSLALNSVTSNTIVRAAPLPEPGSLALLGIGAVGMGWFVRRRGRNS